MVLAPHLLVAIAASSTGSGVGEGGVHSPVTPFAFFFVTLFINIWVLVARDVRRHSRDSCERRRGSGACSVSS